MKKIIFLLVVSCLFILFSCNNKNGMSMKYDADGLLSKVTNHRNGKLHGRQFFYENGKLIQEMTYFEDSLHGLKIEYSANRDTLSIVEYNMGKVISE